MEYHHFIAVLHLPKVEVDIIRAHELHFHTIFVV